MWYANGKVPFEKGRGAINEYGCEEPDRADDGEEDQNEGDGQSVGEAADLIFINSFEGNTYGKVGQQENDRKGGTGDETVRVLQKMYIKFAFITSTCLLTHQRKRPFCHPWLGSIEKVKGAKDATKVGEHVH